MDSTGPPGQGRHARPASESSARAISLVPECHSISGAVLRRLARCALLVLATVLVLAGCESAAPVRLGRVQAPGVRPVLASGLPPAQLGQGQITALRVAAATGAEASPWVIFARNANLWRVHLDGTGVQQLTTDQACGGNNVVSGGIPVGGNALSVTEDGRWVLCEGDADLRWYDLSHPGTFTPLPANVPVLHSAVLSPNGHWVIGITGAPDSICALAVFATRPPFTTMSEAANITFTDLPAPAYDGTPVKCTLAGLAWSPDGRYLSLTQGIYGATLYSLDLKDLGALVAPSSDGSVHQIVTSLASLPVLATDVDEKVQPAWTVTEHGLAITFCAWAGALTTAFLDSSPAQITLASATFTSAGGSAMALDWAPGGQQMVFALGLWPIGELAFPPPSVLYVYSPLAEGY